MTTKSTGTAPQRPSLAQLSDAISEVLTIAEATDSLIDVISESIVACGKNYPALSFGPVDGLTWLSGKLMAHIHKAEEMAEALAETQP